MARSIETRRLLGSVLVVLALQGCAKAAPPAAGRAAAGRLEELSIEGLQRTLRDGQARATVVNVWATWCLPCREEFPDLLRFEREYRDRGVRLLLISADFPDRRGEAGEFLASRGVSFTSYLKTGPDMEFIDALSKDWSGSLPGTFVFDGSGALRRSFEGTVDFSTLARGVEPLLSPDAGHEGGKR